MQALQSNKASDFLQSDSDGVHLNGLANIRSRDLASAFDVSVQAARRFLERRRANAIESGVSDSLLEDASGDYPANAHLEPEQKAKPQQHAAGEHAAVQEAMRHQDQRLEQNDQRLEQSLHEGRSIEAVLKFEALSDFDEIERAYLAEGDGSEPLFSYADSSATLRRATAAISSPNPENVRNAILRLAREANGPAKVSMPASILDPEWILAQSEPASRVVHTSAFADVARRVWGTQVISPAGTPESTPLIQRRGFEDKALLVHSFVEAENGAFLPQLKVDGPRESEVHDVAEEVATLHSPVTPYEMASQPPVLQLHALHSPASELTAFGMVHDSVAGVSSGCAYEDAALAHDACNLLSALGLYGDLLAYPGVLAEEHHHYAGELKLIAGRSHMLISRILKLSDPGDDWCTAAENATPTARQQPGMYTRPRTVGATAQMDGTPAAGSADVIETSLVDLLTRWRNLLSTLSHGSLEISFGPNADTPVPMAAESLERVLVNLVRNARSATIAGGAIRIGVGALDGIGPIQSQGIALTVDDSGCGMTQGQVDHLLGLATADMSAQCVASGRVSQETASEGYGRWRQDTAHQTVGSKPGVGSAGNSQGERTAEVTSSSVLPPAEGHAHHGLGLQVVRDLVRASGGLLLIQSSVGRGTRVEIRWPTAQAQPVADQAQPLADQIAQVATRHPSVSAEVVTIAAVIQAEADPTLLLGPEMVAHKANKSSSETVEVSGPVIPQVQAVSVELATSPGAVGPDGFSEAELRMMMLRLHRSSPPLGRFEDETGSRREAFQGNPQRYFSTSGEAAGAQEQGSALERIEDSRFRVQRLSQDTYAAVKGAIAC